MQSSLFRCGIQGCGSKGAQSIDKFGIKKDGTRMITCISCIEKYEVYRAAFRVRQDALASNSTPTGRPAKRRRMLRNTMAPEAVKLAVGLLEDGFELREAASKAFPPEITSSHIRVSVPSVCDYTCYYATHMTRLENRG